MVRARIKIRTGVPGDFDTTMKEVAGHYLHASGALEIHESDGSITLLSPEVWIDARFDGAPLIEVNVGAAHKFVGVGSLVGGTCQAEVIGAGGRPEVCGLPAEHEMHGTASQPVEPASNTWRHAFVVGDDDIRECGAEVIGMGGGVVRCGLPKDHVAHTPRPS